MSVAPGAPTGAVEVVVVVAVIPFNEPVVNHALSPPPPPPPPLPFPPVAEEEEDDDTTAFAAEVDDDDDDDELVPDLAPTGDRFGGISAAAG